MESTARLLTIPVNSCTRAPGALETEDGRAGNSSESLGFARVSCNVTGRPHCSTLFVEFDATFTSLRVLWVPRAGESQQQPWDVCTAEERG